jgi:hypothetical protein
MAAARDLTRLELITETIRAALEELAPDAPHLLDGLVDEEWAKRYGRPVRLVSQPSRPATRLKQAGLDAFALLQSVGPEMTSRARPHTRQAETLRQIFLQNFLLDSPVDGHGDAVVRPRTEADGSRPVGCGSSPPTTWRPDGVPGRQTMDRLSDPHHRDLR